MVHVAGFFAVAPFALAIITMFGRKGKKEEEKDAKALSSAQQPSPISSASQPPVQAAVTRPPTSTMDQPSSRITSNQESGSNPEENSLNQLLQSLLKDVSLSSPTDESKDVLRESTFEWVPPMTSPPSRKMVLVEDDKGEKTLAPFQPDEPKFYAMPSSPEPGLEEEVKPQPPIEETTPPPKVPNNTKNTIATPEIVKPPRPEAPSRPESTQDVLVPSPKIESSPGRLFQITNGSLDSPGLVAIEGQNDSVKANIVLSLAGKYLAAGTDCILVSYDRPVAALRENIKNAGWDASGYETSFHLLIFDAFSGQTDTLSIEPYSIEKPFDLADLTAVLERNALMMMTSQVKIIIDSLTILVSRNSSKDFLARFRAFSDRMKQMGSTFIVTLDPSSLSKEAVASVEDIASCVIEVQGASQNGGQLRVKKANGALSKLKPEEFEIQPGKGLLFT